MNPLGGDCANTYTDLSGGGITIHDYYAVERELDALGLGFDVATIDATGNINLNTMTQDQFNAYKLFIVPGGEVHCIVPNWSDTAQQIINQGALTYGVSYLGICAGAFVAGDENYPTLNLTGLPPFGGPNDIEWDAFEFYYPYYQSEDTLILGNSSAGPISIPNTPPFGTQMNAFWFDGPHLDSGSGAPFGNVLAKYDDGTSAVVENTLSNNGFIVLSGVHLEAPASWFSGEYGLSWGNTAPPIQNDFAFISSLIESALTKTMLPHF